MDFVIFLYLGFLICFIDTNKWDDFTMLFINIFSCFFTVVLFSFCGYIVLDVRDILKERKSMKEKSL